MAKLQWVGLVELIIQWTVKHDSGWYIMSDGLVSHLLIDSDQQKKAKGEQEVARMMT